MNHRIAAILEGIKSIGCACNPKEQKYLVCYRNDDGEWVEVETMAYTAIDAAQRRGKIRGRNCFVKRVIQRRDEDV